MTKASKVTRLSVAPVADQRLLSLLKHSGRIDSVTAAGIERAMAAGDLSAIDAVTEKGGLSESDIARTIAAELKLPLVDLHSTPCSEEGVGIVNKETARHYTLVPARMRNDTLIVAMANPLDREALSRLESSTRLKLQPVVATAAQILEAIDQLYKGESAIDVLLADIPQTTSLEIVSEVRQAKLDITDVRAITREAEQPPIVKMVNLILFEALKARASDVHIEPGPNLLLVRFRIDGILEDHLQIPKWVQSPIVARIKVMAKLDITERRVPQDGHLAVRVRDALIDVRVSSMPTTYGEKIVLRLLDPASGPRRLDQIGLSARDLAQLRDVIRRPEGMILVTGPTGAGKTTTLYAIIQELLSPEINVVTIENPVEYELKGVSQISINEKQGLTFSQVLRSVLRQDPDVILVGEIRDRETAEIAFQAAQTGHLVLSTVHTNDSVATVTRLLELGVEPQLLGPSLLAVVAQRLMRKVCEACRSPMEPDEEARRAFGLPAGTMLHRGRGCPACRNSGFSGRTGCYEVLKISQGIEQLIEQKAPESAVQTLAVEQGMTSLVVDARSKVIAGVSTPAEVLRVVEVANRGPSCPACRSAIEATFTVCPYCSTPLQLTCTGCGGALKKTWATCPFCGTDAASAAGSSGLLPEAAPSHRELGVLDAPRILIVDDDEDILELVRVSLTRQVPPCRVETAASGEEALAKVAASRPHLVLLDLMMPGMDGYEVCRRLRANLATALIPIIMLTALGDIESKRLGFLAGTDDYVVKPFELMELQARVRRLLERTYGWSSATPANGLRQQSRAATA